MLLRRCFVGRRVTSGVFPAQDGIEFWPTALIAANFGLREAMKRFKGEKTMM